MIGLRRVGMALIWLPMLLLGGADWVPATPIGDLACVFHHPVVDVDTFRRLPRPIVKFMLAQFPPDEILVMKGGMAERGELFNMSDAITDRNAPTARFIRGGRSGHRWFLMYEHGGRPYFKNGAVFSLKKGETVPHLIGQAAYEDENPCLLTDQILD